MDRIFGSMGQRWPYVVTGFLCVISALAIFKGYGEYMILLLVGIPAIAFFLKRPFETVLMQIIYSTIVWFLVNNMGFTSLLLYFSDLLIMISLVQIIINFQKMSYKLKYLKIPFIILGLIMILNIISAVYNRDQSSFLKFMYAFYLDFRFIVFLIACIMFIDRKSLYLFEKSILALYILQVIISTLEFLFFRSQYGTEFGIHSVMNDGGNVLVQDLICGTLGTNGSLVVFVGSVTLYAYYLYSEKRISSFNFWFVLCSGIYMAVISEGKGIFVFDVIILFFMFFQQRITLKKIVGLISFVIVVNISINIFCNLYPAFRNVMNLDSILGSLDHGYLAGTEVNRLNGPEKLRSTLDSVQNLIGIGYGNGIVSSFSLLKGNYCKHYAYTRYYFFYIAYRYVENGWIGLCLWFAFYLSFFRVAFQIRNKISKNALAFLIGLVLLFVLMILYGNTLIMNYVTYVYYFFLSVPFILLSVPNYESTDMESVA